MKVTNFVRDNEGFHQFNVAATEHEVGLLINIALQALLVVGQLSEEDMSGNEINLADIPIENMFSA